MRVVHVPGGIDDEEREGPFDADRRVLATDVELANTTFSRARGLMLRSAVPEDYALVFPLETPGKQWIHTWLVRVPIDVVWTVEGEVTRVETMRPWLALAAATADRVFEFRAGGAEGVEPGDVLELEE